MRKQILFMSITLILLMTTSCATIFSGTSQTVSFQSDPPAAEVITVMKNGTEMIIGTTPCTVSIKRKTSEVKFLKENYYTETYSLRANAKVNGLYWLDVASMFIGVGFIGAPLDLITGAYIKLPEQVKVELKKKN